MQDELGRYIQENKQKILDLAVELCQIPSPTGHEEKKADFIRQWLKGISGRDADLDEAGNVIYTLPASGSGSFFVYAAHMDTVFGEETTICPSIAGNRILAPSIWDNSINIAGLLFLVRWMEKAGIPPRRNILFVFDTGEEGYGNLKGIRYLFESWKGRICGLLAVDIGYDGVIDKAVGSRRYSVLIETKGGHSWLDFGAENAIAIASQIIAGLYSIHLPPAPKTTYNAGIIKGGTSVNTIAGASEIQIDLRSEDAKCLSELENKFLQIVEGFQSPDVNIYCTLTGDRPCGSGSPTSDLMARVIRIRQELGLGLDFGAGSTDANIPLSLGIPAVSFGVCNGGDAHTLQEYIETDTLETGIRHLFRFAEEE